MQVKALRVPPPGMLPLREVSARGAPAAVRLARADGPGLRVLWPGAPVAQILTAPWVPAAALQPVPPVRPGPGARTRCRSPAWQGTTCRGTGSASAAPAGTVAKRGARPAARTGPRARRRTLPSPGAWAAGRPLRVGRLLARLRRAYPTPGLPARSRPAVQDRRRSRQKAMGRPQGCRIPGPASSAAFRKMPAGVASTARCPWPLVSQNSMLTLPSTVKGAPAR